MKLFKLILIFTILGVTLSAPSVIAQPSIKIYHKTWIDFNKNGQKDLFEDSTQPIPERVKDLLSQMTLEEKSCQLATLLF